jgi:hypothetical protein
MGKCLRGQITRDLADVARGETRKLVRDNAAALYGISL